MDNNKNFKFFLKFFNYFIISDKIKLTIYNIPIIIRKPKE